MTAGILSSVLTVAGLISPYFELYKRQGQVIGISTLDLPTMKLDHSDALQASGFWPLTRSERFSLCLHWVCGLRKGYEANGYAAVQHTFDILGASFYFCTYVDDHVPPSFRD